MNQQKNQVQKKASIKVVSFFLRKKIVQTSIRINTYNLYTMNKKISFQNEFCSKSTKKKIKKNTRPVDFPLDSLEPKK